MKLLSVPYKINVKSDECTFTFIRCNVVWGIVANFTAGTNVFVTARVRAMQRICATVAGPLASRNLDCLFLA